MSAIQYVFSDFLVDAREETLHKAGAPLKLSIRAFQVLRLLVENAGSVVTKEDFFRKVWQGAFVEDNNLTVAVAQIRKVLGETADNKFIETVPKKGYRFVAEVEKVFGDETAAPELENFHAAPKSVEESLTISDVVKSPENSPEKSASIFTSRKILALAAIVLLIFSIGAFWKYNRPKVAAAPAESVAVLPFTAEKSSPDTEIFAEKLTRELIRNLGRVSDVRISAHEAVQLYSAQAAEMDLAQIGESLQVDGVVTGKIKSGADAAGELEIIVTDLRTGETIYTNRYSLKPQDFTASQYRIARDIARELGKIKAASDDTAATTNLEAYQAYLLARHHLGKDLLKDYEKAIENFTQAALKDDSFADAYAGLATTHVRHGLSLYANRGLSASRQSFPAAKENALKALAIKPDSDEALAALAFVNYRYEYDWNRAENNFKRALAANPNNVEARRWFGEFLHLLGRFDEGFAEQQKARLLEPNSARILSEIAWGNYLARRFDEAEDYARKSIYIDRTHAATLYNLSEIYEQKGNVEESVLLWKEAMMLESAARRWIAEIEKSFQTGGRAGFARAKIGWLTDLIGKDYIYPTDIAKAHAALEENERTIEWLEKAFETRAPDVLSIKHAPAFDKLKTDERFQKILDKMKFPRQ